MRRPVLLMVTPAHSAGSLSSLFSTRGFDTRVFGGVEGVRAFLARSSVRASVALLDFAVPEAAQVLALLRELPGRPALVGVVEASALAHAQDWLDAAFVRPVDEARLFVRVVALAAARGGVGPAAVPAGGGAGEPIAGNSLFRQVVEALRPLITAVHPGVVIEGMMRLMGSQPDSMSEADLSAALASGRMTSALARVAGPEAAREGIRRLGAILEELRRGPGLR